MKRITIEIVGPDENMDKLHALMNSSDDRQNILLDFEKCCGARIDDVEPFKAYSDFDYGFGIAEVCDLEIQSC